MSDYREFQQRLREYIVAVVPLVVVRTAERQRVQCAVRAIASDLNIRAYGYTDAKQMESLNNAQASQVDVHSDPLGHIKGACNRDRHQTFLLCDTRRLGDDTLYTRELLSLAHLARDTGNTIVIIAAEDVWPRLATFGLCIELQLPTFDERVQLIADFASRYGERVALNAEDTQRLATMLRGLSEVQITNLLRASIVRNAVLSGAHVSEIASHKDRLFARVSNIVPVDVPAQLQVAGLTSLKTWLEAKREVFFATDDQLAQYDLEPPKGILLMGVPGCGKSFSARMIAAQWQLPLYRFDLGSVYDKYVGESERRMQEALDYIDNIAPCVLWVDEIEKALGSDNAESDVSSRVLGQMLFWLQESKRRVFLVATANNVDRLPPELFRKGRFSENFFIDLPNAEERGEAIALYAARSLHVDLRADELDQLVALSDRFSYADIEQAVKDTTERYVFQGVRAPVAQELAEQFKHTVIIAPERLEHMREWGTTNARQAS
ncbi:AAA family ATPase [Bifidobacterium pseudolongum]|uniref:AAA family ATPase n=1 Tax=Bifidobacterium pseudolongum TaxID=1694 RepID=UPI00102289CB|nr:AAA family ATPase [Bifidobacterium pseudolongum]RYQ44130.1 ATPase [Bifidobacterium pseudolongum subsp. globosum]